MRNGSYWEHWGGDSSETQAYAPPSRQTDTGQGGIQGGRPGRKGKEGVRHRPRRPRKKREEGPNPQADARGARARRGRCRRREAGGCGCGRRRDPLPRRRGPAPRRLHKRSVAATSRRLAVVLPPGKGRGERGHLPPTPPGREQPARPSAMSPKSALVGPGVGPKGPSEARALMPGCRQDRVGRGALENSSCSLFLTKHIIPTFRADAALCSPNAFPAPLEGDILILNRRPAPELTHFNWAALKFTPSVKLHLIWVSFTLPGKVRLNAESGLIPDMGNTTQEQEHSTFFVYSLTVVSFVPNPLFPLQFQA